MARLNATKRTRVTETLAEETTTNLAGGKAFKLTPHAKLIEQVVGAFWNEDLYYAKGSKTSAQIVQGVKDVAKDDPRFPLQLAAYARNVLYLRTTPQVLLVEASRIEACKPFVREYTSKIVKRADELTDIVAYYTSTSGSHKGFPNSLKRGLADAFVKFDEYQLNKYDSSKSVVTLGQVAQLVHPALGKAMYNFLTKDEVDAEALPKIGALKALLAKDKIDAEAIELIGKSNVTWETLISKFGASKETWELVIPNMGYMALLRNLRNFEQKGVNLTPVLARIANPEEVKRSKQLPYRFYSAYLQVSEQKVQRAIAQAFEHSISNVRLEGRTAVMVDLSGSMGSALSDKSAMSYRNVGTVLGAIVVKKSEESVAIGFGDTAQIAKINPDDTMMTNIDKIDKLPVGHSTNAYRGFQVLGNRVVDRVVVISDMQCYGGNEYYGSGLSNAWDEYVKNVNPNARLYSLDVSAYGSKQFPSRKNNVVTLNGWSDKIIDMIGVYEREGAMLDEVRKW